MTDEVKFTNEQWDALAEAAEVFAQTLIDEQSRLRDLISKNWAGDCVEGVGVFETLRALVHGDGGSFTQQIDAEASYLRSVALQCRGAKVALTGTDNLTAEQLGS